MEDERDIVAFTDEEGNEIELEVIDYFMHNNEEYAVLIDTDVEDCCGADNDEDGCDCGCDHDHEQNLYIMKVVINGDMEEFIPVDESEMDELSEIVMQRLSEEDEDDEDYDEE